MRSYKLIVWAVTLLGLAACGTESPVELEELLPGGGIRTGEAVFDAVEFIEWDSVRTGFNRPQDVGYLVAANAFDGALDAHMLLAFSSVRETLSYTDTAGVSRVDTLPELVSGNIRLKVDPLRTATSAQGNGEGEGAIEVAIYRATESWDWNSADWTVRIDSGSVREEWTEPGGTLGGLLGTGRIEAGDTLVAIALEPEAIASFRDPEVSGQGVVARLLTPGSRIQVSSALLQYEARPAFKPDTLLADSTLLGARVFLLKTTPEADGSLLIGGLPSWRSYLRLSQDLGRLEVPCPGTESGCTMPLRDVDLNHAALELQPVPAPAGFATIDTAYIETRTVLPIDAARVPLSRAPLGRQLGGFVATPPTYRDDQPKPLMISVTELINAIVIDSTSVSGTPRTLAILGNPEGARIGVGAYGSTGSGALAPRLRLIYSVMKEGPDQ